METLDETKKNREVKLTLVDTKCLEFDLIKHELSTQEPLLMNDFEFDIKSVLNLNDKEETLMLTWAVKVKLKNGPIDQSLKSEICTIKSLSLFKIGNLQLFKQEVSGYQLPDDVLILFFNVSLSNTRGMLIAKLENTPFANAIIPMVDPKNYFPLFKS